MDHVAIMKKSWGLIPKILSGEKTIESRWYMARYPPWNRIYAGDIVYFKDSGEPVTARAEVSKVLQFRDLTRRKVREILDTYSRPDGIGKQEDSFYSLFEKKKYCMLIFLKNPCAVEPFKINKSGFGISAAWMCVPDINKIKA